MGLERKLGRGDGKLLIPATFLLGVLLSLMVAVAFIGPTEVSADAWCTHSDHYHDQGHTWHDFINGWDAPNYHIHKWYVKKRAFGNWELSHVVKARCYPVDWASVASPVA